MMAPKAKDGANLCPQAGPLIYDPCEPFHEWYLRTEGLWEKASPISVSCCSDQRVDTFQRVEMMRADSFQACASGPKCSKCLKDVGARFSFENDKLVCNSCAYKCDLVRCVRCQVDMCKGVNCSRIQYRQRGRCYECVAKDFVMPAYVLQCVQCGAKKIEVVDAVNLTNLKNSTCSYCALNPLFDELLRPIKVGQPCSVLLNFEPKIYDFDHVRALVQTDLVMPTLRSVQLVRGCKQMYDRYFYVRSQQYNSLGLQAKYFEKYSDLAVDSLNSMADDLLRESWGLADGVGTKMQEVFVMKNIYLDSLCHELLNRSTKFLGDVPASEFIGTILIFGVRRFDMIQWTKLRYPKALINVFDVMPNLSVVSDLKVIDDVSDHYDLIFVCDYFSYQSNFDLVYLNLLKSLGLFSKILLSDNFPSNYNILIHLMASCVRCGADLRIGDPKSNMPFSVCAPRYFRSASSFYSQLSCSGRPVNIFPRDRSESHLIFEVG